MSDFKPVNQTITTMSADPGEEFPFLHTITVVDRVVSVDKPELVQNNIKTETVTLNLDSEWDGLSCIINIGSGETPTSLIWSGQPVTIPAELMTDIGTLNVSVVGYGDDGALRAVTKKADAMFTVVASGYVEGDEPVPDPTTILGQLTEAADRANQAAQNADDSTIDKVDVTMLPTGSSPSGSVSDKTLSLSIPNGPRGPQGPKGDPGDLTTVAHDATLTGAGTADDVLKISAGFYSNALGIGSSKKLDDLTDSGVYRIDSYLGEDSPLPDVSITAIVVVTNAQIAVSQSITVLRENHPSSDVYVRSRVSGSWTNWIEHGEAARTVSNPTKCRSGTIDLNSIVDDGAYAFGGDVKITNGPQGSEFNGYIRGLLLHSNCSYPSGESAKIQVWFNRGSNHRPFSAMRINAINGWSDWKTFAFTDDLSNYVPLSMYQALETRVQALEAKLASQ